VLVALVITQKHQEQALQVEVLTTTLLVEMVFIPLVEVAAHSLQVEALEVEGQFLVLVVISLAEAQVPLLVEVTTVLVQVVVLVI
jgi:hypothetical protein